MIWLLGIYKIGRRTTDREMTAPRFSISDNMWDRTRRKKKEKWQKISQTIALGDIHVMILFDPETKYSELFHFRVIFPKPFLIKQNWLKEKLKERPIKVNWRQEKWMKTLKDSFIMSCLKMKDKQQGPHTPHRFSSLGLTQEWEFLLVPVLF